ncbi:hypothetical protein DPMN_042214 [Dreissena polymorpha]|uniref:Uncharacterized protein n=1 Tax=Dreissena polymorpha TaxID=45954 RepID=A0A9D4D0Q8_DREPO|nr:hypothetical protein DPMN_042214 [Dreissena polymorpha]
MHMEGTDRDPSWMLCMPLLHLVGGVCAPFEEPKVDLVHDDKTPKWWGIAEVSSVVETFKEKRNWLM